MENRLNFNTVEKYINGGNYDIQIELLFFKDLINRYLDSYQVELNPDFQRGHVWSVEKQIKYVEFVLKGGKTTPIIFNHPEWKIFSKPAEMVCVDGLQRTTALLNFLNNELPVFGGYLLSEIDNINLMKYSIYISINNIKSKKQIVQWYLELNENSTPHTAEEIQVAKNILKNLE